MFTFETADQKEVRRFRIAQFNGRTATVRSSGSTITGHVRSVLESKSVPPRWTITIVPTERQRCPVSPAFTVPPETSRPPVEESRALRLAHAVSLMRFRATRTPVAQGKRVKSRI
jgi:hypothetical protein